MKNKKPSTILEIIERFDDGTIQVEPENLVASIMLAIGDDQKLPLSAWDRIASLNSFILRK